MTTLIHNWFKRIFTHHALSDQNLSQDRCTIVTKPSTMSDVDEINCNDVKTSTELKPSKKDIIVKEKFQACFIDCTCQCEVK